LALLIPDKDRGKTGCSNDKKVEAEAFSVNSSATEEAYSEADGCQDMSYVYINAGYYLVFTMSSRAFCSAMPSKAWRCSRARRAARPARQNQ
jgi:hypothetical protein